MTSTTGLGEVRDLRPASPGPLAPNHRWDRNFFLVYAGLIWFGILVGFGTDIARHFRVHAAPYPLIVHAHAAAFMGWLVLFTGQILLVRAGRTDLHRKLGVAMIALALAMAVLGPATAIIADRAKVGTSHADPAFVSIQFTDIVAFVGLVGAAVLLRAKPSAHKRLMLLATLYITDAGFGRWVGDVLHITGQDALSMWASLYGASTLLVLGLGAYDLATRRRLHPAWVWGLPWIAAMQATALVLYLSPAWTPVAAGLIGKP